MGFDWLFFLNSNVYRNTKITMQSNTGSHANCKQLNYYCLGIVVSPEGCCLCLGTVTVTTSIAASMIPLLYAEACYFPMLILLTVFLLTCFLFRQQVVNDRGRHGAYTSCLCFFNKDCESNNKSLNIASE